MRVLIADDNEINREFLFGVLAGADYQIEQACDGKEAVEMCLVTEFDAILMDIRMPEVDGIEATRLIRELPAYRTTPIVALTADLQLEQKSRLLERGFDATLTKPVSRDTLLGTLRGALGEKTVAESAGHEREPPIDQAAALAAAGGNQQLLDRLTAMLVTELDQFIPRLQQAEQTADLSAIREMAHKLRGSTGYCGAKPLQRAAAALELIAQREESEAILAAIQALEDEARHLRAFVGA